MSNWEKAIYVIGSVCGVVCGVLGTILNIKNIVTLIKDC